MSEKLPTFESKKFQNINLKINRDQLNNITEVVANIIKYDKTIQITRNTLIYSLLKAAIQNDIKILEIDEVKYTFSELVDLPKKSIKIKGEI